MDTKCINTIRCLSAAQVQQANSGHPGTPMGCAPIGHLLFRHVMSYDATDPTWCNRDRFVLSSGHGSALLYSLLHLSGHDLSVDDLRKFRQLKSKTPGHPECFATPGVEVTTGPLGQGIAQAVGMAIGSHHMAQKYNRPNMPIFDNYVYSLCGEGCLEEGVSAEAVSLAGHLGLGRLVLVFDCNKITIDGSTDLSFTEDVLKRFSACNWHVQEVEDGNHDLERMKSALHAAKAETKKPSIILIRTTIGYGAAKQGTQGVHGAPLGSEDLKNVRQKLGMTGDDWFHVDEDVRAEYGIRASENGLTRKAWNVLWANYSKTFPIEAAEITARQAREVTPAALASLPRFTPEDKPVATRAASQTVLNAVAAHLPSMIGGSADLMESNKTHIKAFADILDGDFANNYIRFGIREHAMIAICNGLYAYGGFLPFWATFLNFVTYGWGAARLSALSRFQVLGIATHDSLELGEDGPTHQPIETLALLRATPNLNTVRPCDANEVSGAYAVWLQSKETPTIVCLCRDAVPVQEGSSVEAVSKGVYILRDFDSASTKPKLVLGASGTEVPLVVETASRLAEHFNIRVLSCPFWGGFQRQPKEEQDKIMARGDTAVVGRCYVELANAMGAERLGFDRCFDMTTWGESAPKKALFAHFGFEADALARWLRGCYA